MQKKLHDIGWSDESECQACHKEEGTEKHRLHHCPEWHSRGLQKVGAKSVVQLDYGEELGPLLGMYGSMGAEFEVQRKIKRAELTAFPCLLKKLLDPLLHVDKKRNY